MAKAWLQGQGKFGHLSDWLRQKRHPGGTLPLPLGDALINKVATEHQHTRMLQV